MARNTQPEDKKGKGYIALYRSVKENWIYEKGRKRTRFEAWIDLLLMASHSGIKEPIGNDLIQINRGDILTSALKLSKEWRWSISTIKPFLKLLEKDAMIILETTSKYTRITICKYDSYQVNPTASRNLPETYPKHDRNLPETYNKGNNDNNDKEAFLKQRKIDFGKTLEEHKDEYSREMLIDFYNYWGEANRSQTKLRWEGEKTWELKLRLEKWKRKGEQILMERQGFGNKTGNVPTGEDEASKRIRQKMNNGATNS